jgi:hypothetical protein
MLRHEEMGLKLAFIENTAVLLGSVYRINSGRRCLWCAFPRGGNEIHRLYSQNHKYLNVLSTSLTVHSAGEWRWESLFIALQRAYFFHHTALIEINIRPAHLKIQQASVETQPTIVFIFSETIWFQIFSTQRPFEGSLTIRIFQCRCWICDFFFIRSTCKLLHSAGRKNAGYIIYHEINWLIFKLVLSHSTCRLLIKFLFGRDEDMLRSNCV